MRRTHSPQALATKDFTAVHLQHAVPPKRGVISAKRDVSYSGGNRRNYLPVFNLPCCIAIGGSRISPRLETDDCVADSVWMPEPARDARCVLDDLVMARLLVARPCRALAAGSLGRAAPGHCVWPGPSICPVTHVCAGIDADRAGRRKSTCGLGLRAKFLDCGNVAGRVAGRAANKHLASTSDPQLDEWFCEAQTEYLKGHWFEAETLLARLLSQRPDDVEGRLLARKCPAANGAAGRGAADLGRASPERIGGWLGLGNTQRRAEDRRHRARPQTVVNRVLSRQWRSTTCEGSLTVPAQQTAPTRQSALRTLHLQSTTWRNAHPRGTMRVVS